jgi:hypothetical protein
MHWQIASGLCSVKANNIVNVADTSLPAEAKLLSICRSGTIDIVLLAGFHEVLSISQGTIAHSTSLSATPKARGP